MDRTAIFIDAGYLYAAGSILLTGGQKLSRIELVLNYEGFLAFIRNKAEALTGLPLLRVYWYDGASGPPTESHIALAYKADVKLRLGLISSGIQKGVDSLLVSDLINLSRNRAMANVILMTGDEDIRIGVQQAQDHGVRVHLLGIAPVEGGQGNQSGLLRQEADGFSDLTKAEVESFLSRRVLVSAPAFVKVAGQIQPMATVVVEEERRVGASDRRNELEMVELLPGSEAAPAPVVPREMSGEEMHEAAQTTIAALPPLDIMATARGFPIPTHIDRQLLLNATKRLNGAAVPSSARVPLRNALIGLCRVRIGVRAGD